MYFLVSFFIFLNLIQAKEISLSFDDAPREDSIHFKGAERADALIKSLRDSAVSQVIFYANPGNIVNNSEKLGRLKKYQKAGHLIGNHTWSHPNADKITAKEFKENILKADLYLEKEKLLTRFFRYPFLRRGGELSKVRDIRKYLESLNYHDAYVTIDTYDWHMNLLFQNALKAGKTVNMDNLKKYYVETILKSVDFFDEMSTNILKHQASHVLLLHENDLAALFMKDLVEALRSKGYKIVSPAESYRDKVLGAYPDTAYHNQGRIAAKAFELGYKGPFSSPYEDESKLDELFKSYEIVAP
jgi:peptidoglycan-N-acetylglucosamine deacetylase